jgi:hypothetical protein
VGVGGLGGEGGKRGGRGRDRQQAGVRLVTRIGGLLSIMAMSFESAHQQRSARCRWGCRPWLWGAGGGGGGGKQDEWVRLN